MSHEERQALIRKPLPEVRVHASSARHGGGAANQQLFGRYGQIAGRRHAPEVIIPDDTASDVGSGLR
jgi:hypothetical protein